ncbi:unnamed protein product, partial [Prorocentrum cordatum]
MVAAFDEDGGCLFDFEDTAASRRSLEQVRECLRSQDPQQLQHFLQRSPFCVDGLLTLAEYFRSQNSPEQASILVRRAVYAIECNFHASFSPFSATGVGRASQRPRVRLRLSDDPSWPGWSWLRALWLHMQGLAGQGMHRTALEVCKLLLATTLPRDPLHVLIWFDYLCLRAKQHDALWRLAACAVPEYRLHGLEQEHLVSNLEMVLPNFAYSAALAAFLKGGRPPDPAGLNEVCVADVAAPPRAAQEAAEGGEAADAHARLMRALLYFPLALRPLLEEMGAKIHGPSPGGSASREAWSDLLARPPFSDAADFQHQRHGAAHGCLCAAYAKR